MPAPKTRRGSAYITVLTVTMLIVMLAAVVLSVTAVSRRLSALYTRYVGLFDLAVAGNDQALFLLHQAHYLQRDDIHERALHRAIVEDTIVFEYYNGGLRLQAPQNNRHNPSYSNGQFKRIFNEEAVAGLRPLLASMFSFIGINNYQRSWGIDATIATDDFDDFAITDSYRATTTLSACLVSLDRFNLNTRIHRYIGDNPGPSITVYASIVWTAVGRREIILDAYTILLLISRGVEFPIPPITGVNLILFLDEFAPTMVESLRHPLRH